MLRHLKMELRRQQEAQLHQQPTTQADAAPPLVLLTTVDSNIGPPPAHPHPPQQQSVQKRAKTPTGKQQRREARNQNQPAMKQRRVRGHRSSKPMMEKRRRARINECLDILKAYVLQESSASMNMVTENQQDEDAIARNILRSSGLINRHKGRKNPNKLEKADILELTVDYLRRLHIQRSTQPASNPQTPNSSSATTLLSSSSQTNNVSVAFNHLVPVTKELSVSLPSDTQSTLSSNGSGRFLISACSLSPPPSSESSSASPQPLLTISNLAVNIPAAYRVPHNSPVSLQGQAGDVLDLSDAKRIKNQFFAAEWQSMGNENMDCWRPWDLTAANNIDDAKAYANLMH